MTQLYLFVFAWAAFALGWFSYAGKARRDEQKRQQRLTGLDALKKRLDREEWFD